MTEHAEQVALFQWADLQSGFFPELAYFYAIPNGGKLPYTRDKRGRVWSPQRALLVAEGLRPGVPDTFLPHPRGEYHGLYIEMKYDKNKPSPDQEQYLQFLADQGYYVAVCWSFEMAQQVIMWYFTLPALQASKGVVKYFR